jgi:polynucleotide 5'-hydroxyl-kinase GRC3/NOL9
VSVLDLTALARRITDRSVALFLGDVDAGKTTLVKQLHERVGGEVVDADVGQAEIGPPAVISVGTYGGGPRAGYFGGDISPRGNFLHVLTGCKKMAERAARPCLIDTDGYIHEGAARAYKSELINLLEPNLLVLLQREKELEYFKLYAAKGMEVVDVAVAHGGLKSRPERVRARERAFQQYFARAEMRRWGLSDLRFERVLLGHGEPLDCTFLSRVLACPVLVGWKSGREAVLVVRGTLNSVAEAMSALDVDYVETIDRGALENLLVGCEVDGEFQGLGILKAIDGETVDILTPAARVTVLQFGSLKVREDGSHERIRLHS